MIEVTKMAKIHNIPVIVDAAGSVPPIDNLKRFVSAGADLVAFSGGKAIRGPQNTGILCGRRDLIAFRSAPDDNSYWYVVQQTGQVVKFANTSGVNSVSTFVDINDIDIGMPFAVLAEDVNWRRSDVYGVPLAVDETLVVEFNVEVNTGGEFYLPPAEVRFRSEHELPETNAINEEGNSAPISDESTAIDNFATACGIENILESSILADDLPIDPGQSSTNSWGSYSDSLSLLFQQLGGINMNFIYIGIGVIAVTGVAVLIYFTANGKRR